MDVINSQLAAFGSLIEESLTIYLVLMVRLLSKITKYVRTRNEAARHIWAMKRNSSNGSVR